MELRPEQAKGLLYEGTCTTSGGRLDLREVSKELEGEWRHGVVKRVVFENPKSSRYYAFHYREGPDGTGFADNNYGPIELYEVRKVTKTITTYE